MGLLSSMVRVGAPGGQMEFVETYNPVTSGAASITSGLIYLGRVRVAAALRVTQMFVQVGTQSGNIDVGIWTYVPATDTGTLVASSGSTAVGASGMQTINLLAAYTMQPGVDYLLGYQCDNATVTLVRASNLANLGLKKRGATISKTFGLATNAASITSLSAGTTEPWIAAG